MKATEAAIFPLDPHPFTTQRTPSWKLHVPVMLGLMSGTVGSTRQCPGQL